MATMTTAPAETNQRLCLRKRVIVRFGNLFATLSIGTILTQLALQLSFFWIVHHELLSPRSDITNQI